MPYRCIYFFFTAISFFPFCLFANHGPHTTGGGATTISGETSKQSTTKFSIDVTYTNYEAISDADIKRKADRAGHFDALRDSYLESFNISHGITDDLEVTGQIGWYSGRGFKAAHASEHSHENHSRHSDESETEVATGSPEGLTDLLVRGKYRLIKDAQGLGNLSIIGGGFLPTGDNNERLSNGERLEPSSQPGSGAFGYQLGASYSRHLSARLMVDASQIYTFRTSNDGFEVGDRIDSGIALTYQFGEEHGRDTALFAEISHNWLGKDFEVGDGVNDNSGGNSLFLTRSAFECSARSQSLSRSIGSALSAA